LWWPDAVERKISLSNIRSLGVSDHKILIGEYSVDEVAEARAEKLITTNCPDLMVLTTPEGKKQIPLQDILVLEEQYRREKEAAAKEAYEQGQKAGYESGLEAGREEARKVVASLSGILSDITGQRQQILEEARRKILEMVCRISQRLTFAAAEINPEITESIINGAIDQLLDKSRIKVKVNPGHLAELEQYIDRFRGRDTAIKEFIIEPDPRVRVGGCFIETPAGDIDARLESMYEIIEQAILEGEDKAE